MTDAPDTTAHAPADAARRSAAHLGPQDRRQRRAARTVLLRASTRPGSGRSRGRRRCRWLAVALLLYLVDDPRQRVALAAAARAPGRRRAVRAAARRRTWSRRSSTTSCQSTSAATSFASATPRGRRLEDAGDDGRAGRSRHRPARAGASSRRSARPWRRGVSDGHRARSARACSGPCLAGAIVVGAGGADARRRRAAAAAAARAASRSGSSERIERLTTALARFRERPGRSAACFGGAVVVQAMLVRLLLRRSRRSLNIPHPARASRRSSCPLSLHRADAAAVGERLRRARGDVRLLLHAARPAAGIARSRCPSSAPSLIMLFSLSGAVAYLSRGRGRASDIQTPA